MTEAITRIRPVEVTLPPVGIAVFESRHAPGFAMQPGTWPFEKLCLVRQGAGALVLDGVERPLAEGDLLRVPPDVRHAFRDRPGEPMTLTMACYDDRVAAGNPMAREILGRLRLALPALSPVGLGASHRRADVTRRLVAMIVAQTRADAAADAPAVLWCRLFDLAVQVAALIEEDRRLNAVAPGERAFARSLAHLDATFTQPLRIAALAAIAGVSYRRYTDLFRRRMGCTVVDHVTRLRLAFAQQRLTETGNILFAAIDAGFGDLSSFYRAFKRATGTTPGRYLKEG